MRRPVRLLLAVALLVITPGQEFYSAWAATRQTIPALEPATIPQTAPRLPVLNALAQHAEFKEIPAARNPTVEPALDAVFDDRAPISWETWEAQLLEDNGLAAGTSTTAAWKEETAALLRSEPHLSLEQAAGKSFGKIHALSPAATDRVEAALAGRPRLVWTGIGEVHQAEEVDGFLYVAAKSGLYREKNGRRQKILDRETYRVALLNDGWYATTADGLYKKRDAVWNRIAGADQGLEGRVHDVLRHDGFLFALTDQGLFRYEHREATHFGTMVTEDHEGGIGFSRHPAKHWQRINTASIQGAGRLLEMDGKLYVCNDHGLFKLDQARRPFLGVVAQHERTRDAFRHGKRLFIATRFHLWERVPTGSAEVALHEGTYSFSRIEGVLYAVAERGVYRLETNGAWTLIAPYQGARQLSRIGDRLYLATTEGLAAWDPGLIFAHPERVGEIAAKIASSPAPTPADAGALRKRDGRSLFSGLTTRIGLKLGAPRAGFAVAMDPWSRLGDWLRRRTGLRLSLKEVAAWRAETARLLSQSPGLTLEEALATALPARRDGTSFAQETLGQERPYAAIPRGLAKKNVQDVAVIAGVLYAACDSGVFVQIPGGRWRHVFERRLSDPRFEQVDGELLLFDDSGAYLLKDGAWTPALAAKGWPGFAEEVRINSISKVDGEYFAATSHGLYGLTRSARSRPWRWKRIRRGYVFCFRKIDSRYYCAAINGLFQRIDGVWERIVNLETHDVIKLGRSKVAVTPVNLYADRQGWDIPALDGGHWALYNQRVSGSGPHDPSLHLEYDRTIPTQGNVAAMSGTIDVAIDRGTGWHFVPKQVLEESRLNRIVAAGDSIYLATQDGLKELLGLDAAWKEALLSDIEQAISLSRTTSSDAAKPSGLTDRRGRSLFSGLATRIALALGGERAGFAKSKDEKPKEKVDVNRLPLEEQLKLLMDKYKVPQSERAARRRLTLEAVERVKLDIPLFADNPYLKVSFGPWWLTVQDLADPTLMEILIPLEDIFVRAVDPIGVKEAVGAAIHEVSHYRITRADPSSPLTAKYVLQTSPKEYNALYQSIEDTRINSWALLEEPGYQPYFDAVYEAMWPKDPDAADRLKRSRIEALARSEIEVKKPGGKSQRWMPPHLQYVNSIIYHWRHPDALPPFLSDPMAREVYDKTLESLERIRGIHPESLGGVLIEPMKTKASREALEAIDKEIVLPYYDQLLEESDRQLEQLLDSGAKIEFSDGEGSDAASGTPMPGGQSDGGSARAKRIREKLDRALAEHLAKNGRKGQGEARANGWQPGKGEPKPGGTPEDQAKEKEDDSWLARHKEAVADEEELKKSWTTYERYRLRANELGLISKVDGIVKKILLPTRHARLSRNHYHEGDEPDMDKYYDDVAQGRTDTPVMRRWLRKIRRSAKVGLVLDISGSMGDLTERMDSKLDYALLGLVAWIEVCQKNGLDFEMMLFDDDQHVVHPFGRTINRERKEKIIADILAKRGGSTAIGAALKAILDHIIPQRATHRFVIFATDEDHNTGESPETWLPLARQHKVVTIAMVIGAEAQGYKHFDYAVRVREAKDFPNDLLDILKKAVRAILGRRFVP